MINEKPSFNLPVPWAGQPFEIERIGTINFLVGPNGSGKSQFASQLARHLQNSRFISTDRLSGMEQIGLGRNFFGDNFASGIQKRYFEELTRGEGSGYGMSSIVLLEERMDLRIRVEATLSHLFDRDIVLEWDSGYLKPMVRRRDGGGQYRLDREECHGIKELLILLTHLYDDQHQYLIIDEPELNLHPQYQAFFMEQVKKIAGKQPTDPNGKVIFLITHSPFILDFRDEDDLRSIISFDTQYSIPKQINNLKISNIGSSSFIRRLKAHHKQLFFSDNPIFVEGMLDAQIVEAMMEARGISIASAGSCIIDVGGSQEVSNYLELCKALNKGAHFLYDLDSLFLGSIRRCVKDDESIQGFLLSAGLGNDFGRYCGELEKTIRPLIENILNGPISDELIELQDFLKNLGSIDQWQPGHWGKARTATVTALNKHRNAMSEISEGHVDNIEGRIKRIVLALREKNIHLLSKGSLENYLPSYRGNEYMKAEELKRKAVDKEVEILSSRTLSEECMTIRYGELYEIISRFPYKQAVDVERVLRNYLSDYIHEFQKIVINHPNWNQTQIHQQLNSIKPELSNIFNIQQFKTSNDNKYNAIIKISDILGENGGTVPVDQNTNAGNLDFVIKWSKNNNQPDYDT